MSTFLDLFPIVLFVVAYKLSNIYTATAVLMGSSVLAAIALYALYKKLTGMQKAALVMVLGFGAVTLIFRNEDFIKWKPTVLYALFAVIFGYLHWIKKINVSKAGLADKLALPEHVWNNLNIASIIYFAFLALLNSLVVMKFSTDEWVSFKLWSIGLTFLFFIGQMVYAYRYLPQDEDDAQEAP